MNCGKTQPGVCVTDVVRRHASLLILKHYMLHFNTGPRNPGLAPTDALISNNIFANLRRLR